MARVSKNIYYNIEESDISLNYKDLILYFSSDFNANRFKTKILDFIALENYKLKAKYNVEVDFTDMLIISFYEKIEKRGFKVYKKVVDLDHNEKYLIKINKDDIINSKVGE